MEKITPKMIREAFDKGREDYVKVVDEYVQQKFDELLEERGVKYEFLSFGEGFKCGVGYMSDNIRYTCDNKAVS